MAIALQRSEVRVAIVVEIHLRTGDDLGQMLMGKRVACDRGCQSFHHGMLRLPPQCRAELVTPPLQSRNRDARIGGFRNCVCELASKRVQRSYGSPLIGW